MFGNLFRTTVRAQLTAADRSSGYVRAVLAEQGLDTAPPAVDPFLFAAVASDGRALDSLLQEPAATTARLLAGGVDRDRALARGRFELARIVSTQVADAGRVADGVAAVASPATGWYRMLQPPSCARCVVLAGRFYRSNQGFLRHPRCDCVHIPAAESDSSLAFDSASYFASLTEAQQNKIFTVDGARAIRDGADVKQVVDVRRGMRTASIGGRDVLITTEGTTRRGWYTAVQRALDPNVEMQRSGRYYRTTKPRLMPEQIYSLADQNGWDRAELVRQLTRNGYLLDRKDAAGDHPLDRIRNALI